MMEEIISGLEADGQNEKKAPPSLLLHSCCGPCSSAVIAALSAFFNITVYYYNPNIDEKGEYEKRKREQIRLIKELPTFYPVAFLEGEYKPQDFLDAASVHAHEKEGGKRCAVCFSLRLEKTAQTAHAQNFDFFATTLTVSPMKDAQQINSTGNFLAEKYKIKWLWSDFKKKDGYKKSVELSKKYNLYRQDYCGCSFSHRKGEGEFT